MSQCVNPMCEPDGQVCPTRPDYVAPLLSKMTSVDVSRLSRGRPVAGGLAGVDVADGRGGGEAGGGRGAAAAAAAAAAKRNDGAAVSAARERFLQRKAGGGAGAGKK